MPEGIPQPDKKDIREEETTEGELTPAELREKLRKLIEGIGG